MSYFLAPFRWMAAMGVALAAALHVVSVLGLTVLSTSALMTLGVLALAVWLPAGMLSGERVWSILRPRFWTRALAGASWRVRGSALLSVAYALFSVVAWRFGIYGKGAVFFALWMALFAAAYAVLRGGGGERARCAGGHRLLPGARFCPKCGEPPVDPTEP